MRKIGVALVATSGLFSTAVAASSGPNAGETIGYFLPKTEAIVSVSQRIIRCPTETDDMEVAAEAAIKPRVVADQYVQVDIRSGLFAERTTKLVLRPNGTLEAFNAKTVSQGGKILGSLTKAALKVASFAAGGAAFSPEGVRLNDPPTPKCKESIRKLLILLDDLTKIAEDLEVEIAREGETTSRVAMLGYLNKKIEFVKGQLTETSKLVISDLKNGGSLFLKAVDYSNWLDYYAPGTANVVGQFGYKVGRDVGGVPEAIKNGDGTFAKLAERNSNGSVILTEGNFSLKPAAALVYRRSVMVPVSIVPCLMEWSATTLDCKSDESFEASGLTNKVRVPAPQLSGLFSLHVGRGGLFGTKEAKAKFDEFGAPLELEYGTGSGTDEAVSVIDAGLAGVVGVRDAQLTELERRIKIAKARKELADLEAGESD